MSTFVCPGCQRSFAEAGFCPYDGAKLAPPPRAGEAAATVRSLADAAAHSARTAVRSMTMPQFGTKESPAITVPTGPALPAPVSTSAPTGIMTARHVDAPTHRDDALPAAEPGKPPASAAKPARLRAVSATEDPTIALASLDRRVSVYDQLVGKTLDGRYLIEKKIGEGGMGVVYSARHAVIERPLAIKVLKPEALREAATITRFVQEAKAASRIGHPNIVDVTDFGTTPEGLTYSVMEYVKGITLALVIKSTGPLPVPRAAAIAQQLARALGAAHDKGIVHRDLKPENIFLIDREGRPDFVKIVDFGIAKVTPIDGNAHGPRLTKAGSVFGTPEYMAPEQAAGRSDIDGRADIYALGVILYEMITGKLPHKGDTAVRTIAMQLLDPIMPPRQRRPDLQISAECEAIVMRALAKRRDERYAAMAELQAALEPLVRARAPRGAAPQIVGLLPLPPGADPALGGGPPHAQGASAAAPRPAGAEASRPHGAPRVGDVPSPPERVRRPSDAPPPVLRAHRASEAPPLAGRAHRASEAPPPQGPAPPALEPPRAIRDEPEFVRGAVSFEHAYLEAPPAPPRRRWPVVVAALLITASAGATIAVMTRRSPSPTTPVAQALVVDAPSAPPALIEAEEPAAPLAPDAGVAAVDAAGPDAPRATGSSSRRRDARATVSGRVVTVQIITYPDDGTVYRGRSYRGPGGTTVQEPYGTVARFTCTKVGYKEGFVDVKFDDKTPIAVCVMTRKKLCVDDLKNPYDHCPDAGAIR
ncbi:MAG: protein kinase [Kofleriaceae bacterium]